MTNETERNNSQKKRYGGSERRRTPRLKREVIVQYRIKELPHLKGVQVDMKPPVDITHTRNLAEEGVFFTSRHAISLQAILDIKLKLPSQKEPISLVGRVIDCEEIKKDFIYGIRVEFFNLNYKRKEALRNFIQLFLKG